MLFTQFNMDDALEVRYEEGVEEGRAEGELLKLIKLVCRKLEKGKRADEIAEELEEEQKIIASICTVAKTCGLDINDIYKELQTMQ